MAASRRCGCLALLLAAWCYLTLHLLPPAPPPRPATRLPPPRRASCASAALNPAFSLREGRVRDPAVLPLPSGGYELYFTHFRGRNPKRMWRGGEAARSYAVRRVRTADWVTFSAADDVTPAGFVSPDAPTAFGGATLLAFQAYPDVALGGPRSGLFFSRRLADGSGWSAPQLFLHEALRLPWNTAGRAIDPTLIVDDGGRLHCFFVGSAHLRAEGGATARRANLLGHAVTDDPSLRRWTILTRDAPLLGVSARAPDGVENVAIFRGARHKFVMVYSEGLQSQHLAHAVSDDLISWSDQGPLRLHAEQRWLAGRYGAPFVWREPAGGPPHDEGEAGGAWCFWMALMGEAELTTHTSFIGLLRSSDGIEWHLLPERNASADVEGGWLTSHVLGSAAASEPNAHSTPDPAGSRPRRSEVILDESGNPRGTLVLSKKKKSRPPHTRSEQKRFRTT
ncbi:hypothetical protein AB1Y20_015922 [Prymnesium parvum]|uniref:Glycosyl hydrolase family 32 N-terminal domain-containing protein n=1 Tax=Prymnesium parvum TaxID=97485 RepID=A0AB34K2F4_PRYPA